MDIGKMTKYTPRNPCGNATSGNARVDGVYRDIEITKSQHLIAQNTAHYPLEPLNCKSFKDLFDAKSCFYEKNLKLALARRPTEHEIGHKLTTYVGDKQESELTLTLDHVVVCNPTDDGSPSENCWAVKNDIFESRYIEKFGQVPEGKDYVIVHPKRVVVRGLANTSEVMECIRSCNSSMQIGVPGWSEQNAENPRGIVSQKVDEGGIFIKESLGDLHCERVYFVASKFSDVYSLVIES